MSEPEHISRILARVFKDIESIYQDRHGRNSEVGMQATMKCPYCGFDCLHLQDVVVNRGGEITSIDHQGTKISAGDPSGRGSRVELTFWCESGHMWRHSIQFHKGSVILEDHLVVDGCCVCMETNFRDLWRD